MEKTIKDTRTDEQKKALKQATITGYFRDLAIARGGTGHQRKPLSAKEWNKRKKRDNVAKQSRKMNRKTG
jgi:hypothetical protein